MLYPLSILNITKIQYVIYSMYVSHATKIYSCSVELPTQIEMKIHSYIYTMRANHIYPFLGYRIAVISKQIYYLSYLLFADIPMNIYLAIQLFGKW